MFDTLNNRIAKIITTDFLSHSNVVRRRTYRDTLKSYTRLIGMAFLFACSIGMSLPAFAALNFTFNADHEGSRPGESIQVEWIVTNSGTVQENNISVELPFPAPGISTLSVSLTDGGDCPGNCDPGETIIWSLGNIPAGESRVASFPLRVATNAVDGSIGIEARLFQGASLLATSGWTQQVQAALVTELAIDSSEALIAPGETFSYGFLAGNRGSDALSSAMLTVPVPSELIIVSAPGGSVSGNNVSWSLGNFPSGRVTRRVINVRVRSNVEAGELLVLDGALLSGNVFGLPQSTTADHVVSVGGSLLDFHIKSQETQLRPGETRNIEIVVSNGSNQTVQNASVSFLYPSNLQTASVSNLLGVVCPGNCDSGERASWNLGNLLPGETEQLRFTTSAASSTPGGVPVKWLGRLMTGSTLVAREYLATGITAVDVNLQIDTDETQLAAGDVYNYTFHVGNTGIDSIASALLTVPVPDDVTVLDTFGGSLSGGTVSWSLNDLSSGAVLQRTLKVRADSGLANGSTINLTDAEVSATVFGIPQSTMAQHFVSVGEVPLEMEVRLQQGVARPGESVLVEIVVSNNSSQVEQNVFAGLLFPDDINTGSIGNLEATICPGNCDTGEQLFVFFGNLIPGETKSVAHSVVVSTGGPNLNGEHTTWVGNVFSDNSPGRRVEATLGISQTGLELQATSEELLVEAGNTIVYQFASGNTAGFVAGDVQLVVPLPSGVTVVSAPGGQVVGDRVIYNLGDLEDEEIVLRNLTISIAGGTPSGSQIVLENIELSGVFFGVDQATYGGHVVTVGNSPLTGGISVFPVDPQPGEEVEVTIDVRNDSSQVQQNVAARLRFPAGVNTLSVSLSDGGACPGNCDSGEDIVWSLGTLVPGDSASISFLTTISTSEPAGGMIEWPARIQAGTTNQRRIEATSLVGNVDQSPPPQTGGTQCNGRPVTVFVANGDNATGGPDVILGTSGPDIINAFGGDDTICGEGGNDIITAGGGNDWVDGGSGDDEIRGNAGIDTIFGGTGNDEILGGTGDDDIEGEEGDDRLLGQPGNDTLDGGDGADEINGGSGNDIIFTGSGATVNSGFFVSGGGGNDEITGGPDADHLIGSFGIDTIFGAGGDDLITGGNGADQLNGGDGNDDIRGQGQKDTLNGDAGDDIIAGGDGNDTINGGNGNDEVNGGPGDDKINGNGGNDLLLGGGGNDALDGGLSAGDECNGQTGLDTAAASCEIVTNVP